MVQSCASFERLWIEVLVIVVWDAILNRVIVTQTLLQF